MPVFYAWREDRTYKRWKCPFCDYHVTVVEPEKIESYVGTHAWKECKGRSIEEVKTILDDVYEIRFSDMTAEELVTEAVLDKL